MLDWVFLTPLRRYSDLGLLAQRLFVGGFLLWFVWSTLSSPDGANVIVTFLSRNKVPYPEVLTQLSIWTQFSIGMAFIMGLFTRWAGIFCVVNFGVAIALLVSNGASPLVVGRPAILMAVGVYLAIRGAGRFGLDSQFETPFATLREGEARA